MSFPKRLLGDEAHGVLAAPNAVLTREEAQNLIARTIKFSKADAIRVNVQSARESNVRFAANQMSTAGLSSTTNDSRAERVRQAEGERRHEQPHRRRAAPRGGAVGSARASRARGSRVPRRARRTAVRARFPRGSTSTAALSAEERAKAALTALAPARAAKDLTVAGFLVTTARATAIGNNAGLFAYHRSTDANYTLTARTNDGTGSGWAGATENDWSKLDFAGVAKRAIDKARASRNPVALEPGRYTVVLEPDATSD